MQLCHYGVAATLILINELGHKLNETIKLADGIVGPRKKCDELGESLVQGMLDGLGAKLPKLPRGTWIGGQLPP